MVNRAVVPSLKSRAATFTTVRLAQRLDPILQAVLTGAGAAIGSRGHMPLRDKLRASSPDRPQGQATLQYQRRLRS